MKELFKGPRTPGAGLFCVAALRSMGAKSRMETWYVFVVLGWILIAGYIGRWIGSYRGRSVDGFCFGALLGPIGWIVAALLPDDGKKCPQCLGVVPERALKCKHCGDELIPRVEGRTAQ